MQDTFLILIRDFHFTFQAHVNHVGIQRFRFKKPQKPYPAYDKGMTKTEWKRDRAKMIERCIAILQRMK